MKEEDVQGGLGILKHRLILHRRKPGAVQQPDLRPRPRPRTPSRARPEASLSGSRADWRPGLRAAPQQVTLTAGAGSRAAASAAGFGGAAPGPGEGPEPRSPLSVPRASSPGARRQEIHTAAPEPPPFPAPPPLRLRAARGAQRTHLPSPAPPAEAPHRARGQSTDLCSRGRGLEGWEDDAGLRLRRRRLG
ncbi:sterile alpha motif domain-containing protein 1-like [Ursus americanus]|uniref:sterile alpha motif domain-containing protein 1-like n=1 Tax=Ursus americanus TaxID=9643 RepID=UPI001E67A560|nr:sterile alpha motif domain-containing protein 1-like [Ursus americanus]